MARDQRRLAAIVSADVAGYSRLMGQDENRTLAALKTHRCELIDPKIAEYGGRIVKTTGDGLLLEFHSVVDSVRCAVDVQRGMADRNACVPLEQQIHFRMGINVGDIIIDGDDIFGDGINIAARLQSLAEPGGICIAGNVYEQVLGKLDNSFLDLGSHQLKNITKPVRAYAVCRDQEDSTGKVFPTLPPPDQPSLAVLPFANMSGDADQEYFADGVVDDIITALTQVRSFFVVARGSSFTYKGQAIDIKRVGRELGVRYVLEGGVHKAGDRLRINGQLVETEDGRNIWAGRFEGAMNDIFELQDKVTEAVAVAVGPSVRLAEIHRAQRKPTMSLQAYDCVYRALAMTLRASTNDASTEALGYLRRAIELDPAYALAKAQAASEIGRRKIQGWSTTNEEKEGFGLAQQALRDHREDPNILSAAGHAIALLSKDIDTALAAVDRAVALNRNSMPVLARAAWVHTLAGSPHNAIEEFQRCMRLSPLDPEMDRTLRGLGCAYLMAEQYDAALSILRRAVAENPNTVIGHRLLVVCLVLMGRLEEAKAAVGRLNELFPHYTVSSYLSSVAIRDRALVERWGEALRVAGIPE